MIKKSAKFLVLGIFFFAACVAMKKKYMRLSDDEIQQKQKNTSLYGVIFGIKNYFSDDNLSKKKENPQIHYTTFYDAIRANDINGVQKLLDDMSLEGTTIKKPDEADVSLAVKKKNELIVRLLLNQNVPVDDITEQLAIQSGNLNIIKLIFEAKKNNKKTTYQPCNGSQKI